MHIAFDCISVGRAALSPPRCKHASKQDIRWQNKQDLQANYLRKIRFLPLTIGLPGAMININRRRGRAFRQDRFREGQSCCNCSRRFGNRHHPGGRSELRRRAAVIALKSVVFRFGKRNPGGTVELIASSQFSGVERFYFEMNFIPQSINERMYQHAENHPQRRLGQRV